MYTEAALPQDPILVVDDEPMLRLSLVRILRSEGHVVIEAANGHDALEAVRDRRPCLIIANDMLQGIDGETFISTMRAEMGRSAPDVVLLCGSPQQVERARDIGALVGLAKPFRVEDVLDIAEQFRTPTSHRSESGVIRVPRFAQGDLDLDGALLRAVAEAG